MCVCFVPIFRRRKLDEKGIGELSFDEVYRALLLGAVPPALVTDAVRPLATGRPREEGGASFLSGETSSFLGAGDVSAAFLEGGGVREYCFLKGGRLLSYRIRRCTSHTPGPIFHG